jgi:hypothetical protein
MGWQQRPGKFKGLYYQFPNADSIKRIYGTCMDEDPALQKSELWNENATLLGKSFSSPSDAATATSTIVSLVDNKNPTLSSTRVMDKYESNLLAAIAKHREDILRLFWAGTGSGKSTIPPKMLRKVRAANMALMTQANSLIAHVGRTNLSTKRSKELGSSNAKLEAKELHDVKVAEQNKMGHGTVSNRTKEMDTNPEIAITEPEVPTEHQMEHEPQEEDMSQD